MFGNQEIEGISQQKHYAFKTAKNWYFDTNCFMLPTLVKLTYLTHDHFQKPSVAFKCALYVKWITLANIKLYLIGGLQQFLEMIIIITCTTFFSAHSNKKT